MSQRRELVQAMQNPIQMHTANIECLLYRLLNHAGWVVLVQIQNPDEFLHSSSFRPFRPQFSEHAVIGHGPFLPPAA